MGQHRRSTPGLLPEGLTAVAAVMSLSQAVSSLVHDGDTIALEGFTHLIPFAAGQEIIRQGRRDLTLVRMTPDVLYDQMIGSGCARKLIFSWGGNPGVGSLHRFRDAVERDWPRPLALEEHSHAGMAARYVAGAQGACGSEDEQGYAARAAKAGIALEGGDGAAAALNRCPARQPG